RPLGGRRQDHQRIGQEGERAAEVQLAEPGGVEAQGISQLDLGQDVLIALALGKAAGAWELIEEAETHGICLLADRRATGVARTTRGSGACSPGGSAAPRPGAATVRPCGIP